MKKDFKTFLIEITTIIVGILVALFINDWNDDRKDKAYIDKIFIAIDKELTETNKDIILKISQQQSFVDTLNFYLDDDKTSILDIAIKADGIHMPTIKLNSWKAMSSSKIELIPYEKISTLANIEMEKEAQFLRAEKLGDYLSENSDNTEREKKEFLKISLLTIIGNEKSLQKEIKKIIDP